MFFDIEALRLAGVDWPMPGASLVQATSNAPATAETRTRDKRTIITFKKQVGRDVARSPSLSWVDPNRMTPTLVVGRVEEPDELRLGGHAHFWHGDLHLEADRLISADQPDRSAVQLVGALEGSL